MAFISFERNGKNTLGNSFLFPPFPALPLLLVLVGGDYGFSPLPPLHRPLSAAAEGLPITLSSLLIRGMGRMPTGLF